MMAWYQRLNPFNHLAGKIFLTFWLMIVATVASLYFVAITLNMADQYRPVPPHIQHQFEMFSQRINQRFHQLAHQPSHQPFAGNAFNLEQLLHMPRLGRDWLIIYLDHNNQPQTNRPPPPEFKLSELQFNQPAATSQYIAPLAVYGPFEVTLANQTVKLFMAKPDLTDAGRQIRDLLPWLKLGIPLLISAILSVLMAMSLVKPIRQLRNAHRDLAQGDLDVRVDQVAVRRDELGQLGQDFNHMVAKVAALLAAQKRLLGDVSHELRSPLARMQIALGLAIQGDSKDLPRHLERIELEANRLDDMIGDVLRLSRLENQLQHIEKLPLSLSHLLQQLTKDADFEARQHHKTVQLTLATDKIWVLGDQSLLASAFENVIRNAVKYTDPDTTVHIAVSQLADHWQVTVSDQGPGVPTSALSQLFEPFYRVSDSRQRRSGGTGLGLAIAEKAIHSHKGTIKATNLPDKGLQMQIRLPIHQGQSV